MESVLQDIKVVIWKKKQVRLRLSSGGQLILNAPRGADLKELFPWIEEQKQKLLSHKEGLVSLKTICLNEKTVTFYGKVFHVKLADEFSIHGNDLFVDDTVDELLFSKAVLKLMSMRFKGAIKARVYDIAKVMGVSVNRVTLKNIVSRWGSCSSKGNININVRLLMSSSEVIDYVIIHELAHRLEMNHSKAFWTIVEKYDPLYKDKIGTLKSQQKQLLMM